MSSRVNATPGELKIVQAHMQGLREALLKHACEGATAGGFADKETHCLAVMMTLLGAAQMYALTQRNLYHVFKSLCADMANSSAESAVMRGLDDMGPEFR